MSLADERFQSIGTQCQQLHIQFSNTALTKSPGGPVVLFKPKYWSGHPRKSLVSSSRKIILDLSVQKSCCLPWTQEYCCGRPHPSITKTKLMVFVATNLERKQKYWVQGDMVHCCWRWFIQHTWHILFLFHFLQQALCRCWYDRPCELETLKCWCMYNVQI